MTLAYHDRQPHPLSGAFRRLGVYCLRRGLSHRREGHLWYGIIIALGVVLALWFCMTQREKYGITEDDLLDAVLWGVPLAIVGARLYYVIFYLDLFKKADGSFDWGSAVAIWDGGLAIYGGVIAAFLTGFVLCRKKGIKMGALTDLVVMGFLIGQAVGRWGNFMNREPSAPRRPCRGAWS